MNNHKRQIAIEREELKDIMREALATRDQLLTDPDACQAEVTMAQNAINAVYGEYARKYGHQ